MNDILKELERNLDYLSFTSQEKSVIICNNFLKKENEDEFMKISALEAAALKSYSDLSKLQYQRIKTFLKNVAKKKKKKFYDILPGITALNKVNKETCPSFVDFTILSSDFQTVIDEHKKSVQGPRDIFGEISEAMNPGIPPKLAEGMFYELDQLLAFELEHLSEFLQEIMTNNGIDTQQCLTATVKIASDGVGDIIGNYFS